MKCTKCLNKCQICGSELCEDCGKCTNIKCQPNRYWNGKSVNLQNSTTSKVIVGFNTMGVGVDENGQYWIKANGEKIYI